MPVILAMWEAKIRRITVPGQPRQKHSQDPISTEKKLGMVAHACHSSRGLKPKIGGSRSRLGLDKKEDPISKIT
jgi:hypothetical protein